MKLVKEPERRLKERRKKPMSFRTLEEFLAEHTVRVYGFSAGEMRKIAHNLHAKAKEEIASGRAGKFRG